MGVALALVGIVVVLLAWRLIDKGVNGAFRPLEKKAEQSAAAKRLERAKRDSGQ